MNIPLVSEYKINFITRRLIQTFFGGFGFDGNQSEQSCSVTFYKVLLIIYPFLVGIIFTTIIEFNCLTRLLASILSGIISLFIMIALHLSVKLQACNKIVPTFNNEKNSTSEIRLFTKIMPLAVLKSKFVIILHSVTSSLLIFLAVYNLNLSVIYKDFNNNWLIAIILFLLCWLSLTISHNSLTISPPPETATYATTVNNNDLISSLNRPFHVLIVLTFQTINSIASNNANNLNILCPILLSAYPFMWLLGILPPLPALTHWLIERTNVIIFGGGPVYSTSYLFVSLLISIIVLIFCWTVDELLFTIYISSVFGFLISNDILSFIRAIKTIKFGSVIMTISLLFSIFSINIITTNVNLFSINLWLVFGIGSLLVLITLIRYSQSVYIFCGLIRNPFYPKSVSGIDVFRKFKQRWESIILIMKILIHFILPLLCLMVVNIELKQLFHSKTQEMNTHSNSTKKLISFSTSFAILSIHRSIWQKTCITAFVILSLHFINHLNLKLISVSLPLQWLLFGFSLNVIIACLEKLYLVIVLIVTSVLLTKQRLSMSWYILGFNILIFPVIILMVLISSIISAPILPLFTLPLFFISFPRPMHFWPTTPSKIDLETEDTIYYQQLMSQFIQSLRKQCPLISSTNTGNFLLARFGDRLIWIQILESGFNYIKIQIKGLELQETSCHSVEATIIDEILEEAFYSNYENSKTCKILNSHFWFTLQPLDTLIVNTYSDARNVLTGVIDSPETFAAIKSVFARVFVWVILKYRMQKTNNLSIQESVEIELDSAKQVENTNTNPNLEAKSMLFCDVLKAKSETASQEMIFQTNNIVLSEWSDDEEETDVLGADTNQYRQNSHISYQSNQIKFENLAMNDKNDTNNESKFKDIHKLEILENQTKKDSLDYNILKPENSNNEIYPNSSDSNRNSKLNAYSDTDLNAISTDRIQANNFSHCYNSLLPTNEWLIASLDYTNRKRINKNLNQFMFSDDWFKKVINILCENSSQLSDGEMLSLIDSYKQIVLVCFSCISPISSLLNNNEMSPQSIYQIFNGKVPDDGFNNKFLNSHKELYEITIKSFQYSVKLAIDQILLGNETLTLSELIENLIDFDLNWFIGDETSIEWKDCLIGEKRNLFSIGSDPIKECFTSHLLSLQEMAVHLCYMNRAVIEAIWSSLSIELLYLTNDDDERYSIQAHPVILRNVTVQSADAPLGYPVFVSSPIIINHFNN